MWSVHTADCHSALTRQETLIHPTAWASLDDITQEASNKRTSAVYALSQSVSSRQMHQGRMVVTRYQGQEKWGVTVYWEQRLFGNERWYQAHSMVRVFNITDRYACVSRIKFYGMYVLF